MTRLTSKQFNMVNGPQGYTGPEGASDERRLGRAYLTDMTTINAGGDASYFPGQGTSQGKFFHDPKPHDAVRFQRGYTPERQATVHGMIDPPADRPVVAKPYSEASPRNQGRYSEAEWGEMQASQGQRIRAERGQNHQARAEFVDDVARSSAPTEDLERLRRDPAREMSGITVSRMSTARQATASGSILAGRHIEMPLRSEADDEDYQSYAAIHELGHAVDHVDRKGRGEQDYVRNEQHLRAYGGDAEKTEAIHQLGRMEGAADVYGTRHARTAEGLPTGRRSDYPTGHYSKAYGSDTGYRNNRPQNKFTAEESKVFRGGYQAVHKAEGMKSPSKVTKIKEKAQAASREATKAAWGEAGRPMTSSPQLQWQEPEEGHDFDERRATRQRNDERRMPWSKY